MAQLTVLGFVSSVIQFVDIWIIILSVVSPWTRSRLYKTHGWVKSIGFYIFLNPAYEQLERMERHIIEGNNAHIEKFRDRYISECNMAAIAVSCSNFSEAFSRFCLFLCLW